MERRNFLKLSATAGAVSCITACGSKSSNSSTPTVPEVSEEQMNWSACLVNCGSNCPIRVFSKDGVVTRIETDNTGTDVYGDHQVRACLRGRSLRQRNYAADRLKAPMKRIGKRGEGQFEEISWEQAFQEIGSKTNALRAEHGPRSVYNHYGSGAYYGFASSACIKRALAYTGGDNAGYLGFYSNYSWAALQVASPATFGAAHWGQTGSRLSQVRNSDLFFGIGFNPMEIRMSGSGEQYDYLKAMEYRRENGLKFESIIIDPRYTDTTLGKEDLWLPIRPGTDAALAEAIAYQMISSGWVDANSKAWLDKYCVGYDRQSIVDALAGNAELDTKYGQYTDPDDNYKDYILGEGKFAADGTAIDADKGAKTPALAAAITGVPEDQIISLADKIMAAEAPYISIGAGCNRQANGESTMRALYMLPILTGKIGQPGVNNGELPQGTGLSAVGMSSGSNPQPAKIVFHNFIEAIENGVEMTALSHSVTGLEEGEKLGTNIKAIFMASGNAIINQQSDINHTRSIIEDDTKCELIVVCDCWMTSSAKFADYILPDTTWLESNDFANNSYSSGEMGYLNFMSTSVSPAFNTKNMYQIGLGLVEAMNGDVEAYTEGRTEEQWLEYLYQQTKERTPADVNLPATYAEAQATGFYRRYTDGDGIVMQGYLSGDEALYTPSGKIEIYSFSWAEKAATLIPRSQDPIDNIDTIGKYVVPWQGYEDTETATDFPLQAVGYHHKGRAHSSFGNVDWIRGEACEEVVWVNPIDAQGFNNGQRVTVTSPQGAIRINIRITNRVAPGVVGLSQGAWYQGGSNDIDEGGCSNTLTKYHPTPIAQANPQHTIRVKLSA